jgi:hypothetical protein
MGSTRMGVAALVAGVFAYVIVRTVLEGGLMPFVLPTTSGFFGLPAIVEFACVALVVSSILLLRGWNRMTDSMLMLGLASVFVVGKIGVAAFRGPLDAGYLAAVTAEGVMVALVGWFALRLSRHFARIERAFDGLVLSESSLSRRPEEAFREAHGRLLHCRRHQRRMGCVVLAPVGEPCQSKLSQHIERLVRQAAGRIYRLQLAGTIDRGLRRTDILVPEVAHGRYVVLCPEAGPADVAQMAARIRRLVWKEFELPLAYGTAVYPEDGSTFEVLVRNALVDLKNRPRMAPDAAPREHARPTDAPERREVVAG